ncbi:xaa-Pro aminopeptidase 1-like [Sitodiplosis mosellana]|uniref:xaa-Pro aminopeptidase 1-like n=1 Tax=Sitodiplosis mosellana TaxID=263140 RepID=UPI002444B21B|nr:xaa-Pro aminopeptidase 1-like [Sitodiplosis mosellana]
MTVASNTKLILTGAALLVAVVGCSVAVTRAMANIENPPEDDGGQPTSAKIVRSIRNTMNDTRYVMGPPIQAYIIPSVDVHQNEDTTDRDKRVAYVSGFTGSSATIVIEEGAAAFWTDSRYFMQAKNQLDNETWIIMKSGQPATKSIQEWLVEKLPQNSRVGIDPFLMKAKEFQQLSAYLESHGHNLIALPTNLVDVVWKNRPELKLKELEPIGDQFSGKRVPQKLAEVRKAMKALTADIMIVTALEDIAWLLNLRGSDFEYAPLFFAYVIIAENDTYLYLLKQDRATTNKIDNHFQTEHIDIIINEYNNTVAGINTVIRNTKGMVLLSSASEAIQTIVPSERRLEAESPIMKMRIIKNDVEAQKMREAHKRDGASIIKYLYWLETEIDDQNITEIKGADKLKSYKSQHEYYRRLSFQTISAVGAHAAMAHYIPTNDSDRQITRTELYLIESGTQYKDGTTDMTRTVHFGTPSDTEKDAFTRVLKGFISVATAVFPRGAPFSFFDAMARRALWDVGLDYDHATGHGVGAFLKVHEYPPLISSKNMPPGMCKNMFTTNEPGYYENGKFGIRLGNVLQVVDAPHSSEHFSGKGAYKFDDITMVPIQKKMINVDLLSESEIQWLNEYHAGVRNNVSPLLSDNSNILEWLERETQPISKQNEECTETTTEQPETTTDQ